ncbi:ead/Ea22-like family protein [Cronobacter turicensis]|uniref:ead/Ea22-like family protein n=1 Tax=Cronobacter turicensis TaxID=413502 RepID=UPI0024C31876|nr:ead/Ea22-like family protein [Cronobacter turicensis]MDK1208246.1 ead/Ea22-like family protein [Cronobacter turicensis]MDK1216831.1 ead/Ea22-like family protein [Cronobacter turicensis]MDK1233836.1 ead/Ea22-like family protein [Cronobacter turicensis]HDI3035747.1 ead/Ea22-like family protein [Cronobacter turicensis]
MNTEKLKAAALAATPGKWWIDSHGSAMVSFTENGMKTIFVTNGEAMGKAVRHQDTGNLSHWRNDNDATFIATANPATVLELIAALEAAEKRVVELEARTLRVHMPALRNAEMMSDLAWNSAIDHCFDALIKATEEAGINLETGGE